ncbi:Nup53/35/40-type RNA recognition motif-domain-containing protein [Rhodotorula diobovata]|uniref:Nup53/35/40-type RNA recognition motif-domain-containing protein n=1 Tax=Rhodotorula diobovata TaxID=5288 RepID=A0A5C5G4R6_9BASI|nr:Nup53/35/40-type RNA recognition motif-domain-containing protein [Rhodotorula diobovata]
MFSQGSNNSPYRPGGFGTPQQGGPIAQPGYGASSSSAFGGFSSTPSQGNNFAGPQFGGGNHGAAGAFGGFGSSGGPGAGSGAAGGYGSPFGGAGGLQGSTGGGSGTPGAKRNYLPGYLSGGVGAQQAESTPPQAMADERAWDSPARRTSVSGSPVTRFGGGSLFGGRESSTPSKSPKFAPYTAPPRASAYKHEVEEDAPPVASLNEFDSGDQSSLQADSNMNGLSRSAANDPTASPFASSSALPHPNASHSSSKGYAVNVFGFPASALELVLEHFSQFGEVLSSTPSTEGGNWVTVVYVQPWSAARAARKNGEVLGGVLMIGVKAVDEDGLQRALASGETAGEHSSSSAPPSRPQSAPVGAGTPSGVGRPVNVLGPQAAFKAQPTPTRKGFLGLGGGGGAGTPGGSGAASGADPHASLFAEKSKQAVLAQQQGQGQKGVLGKVSDLVFGW